MAGLVSRDDGLVSTFEMPVIPKMPTLPLSHANPAAWTFEKLVEYIRAFESRLDVEHEVGASLVSFGPATVLHIERIDYSGPHIISFSGYTEDGRPVQLVQHTSQLNVLLMAVKQQQSEARRIFGFVQGGHPSTEPEVDAGDDEADVVRFHIDGTGQHGIALQAEHIIDAAVVAPVHDFGAAIGIRRAKALQASEVARNQSTA